MSDIQAFLLILVLLVFALIIFAAMQPKKKVRPVMKVRPASKCHFLRVPGRAYYRCVKCSTVCGPVRPGRREWIVLPRLPSCGDGR